MAIRVRRKVVRRPRDEDEDIEEEVVKPARKVVEMEDETGDDLDEVPEQIKKIAKEDEEDIPAIFRRPEGKKVVVPPPVVKKIVVPAKKMVEFKHEELPLEKPGTDHVTKTVNDVVTDNLFGALLEVLQTGGEVIISKLAENKWNLKMNGVIHSQDKEASSENMKKYIVPEPVQKSKTVSKLTGKEYDQEVCTQEYLDFVEEWRGMDVTEKRKLAKSLGAKYDKSDSALIENKNLSMAVQAAKGITKYKPKYQSGKARAELKG